MSDTEAKLDEQDVDNTVVQEAEAKKEDVQEEVKNTNNETEVVKKKDETDATPVVNKSADIALRTRVGGSPIAKKQVKLEDVEDYPVADNLEDDLEIEKADNSENNIKEKKTLPPAQPPPGWNASMQQYNTAPQQNSLPFVPSMNQNTTMFPNQFVVSPMKRSPPRYYGSMYAYTSPNASRYSTLLSSSSTNNSAGSNDKIAPTNIDDIEAYQEQRLVSQELAKLRSQVVELKKEIERQKQKRRDVKQSLAEMQEKYYNLEKTTKQSEANEHGFKREHSRLKEIAIERRAEIESLQEKLSVLQAELRDTRNHNWEHEKDATTQKRLAEHLSKKLSDISKKVEELRNTKQTLLNENETLADERDNLKTEVENLKEDFLRANSVEEELRREIDAQRERISRLNLEIDSKNGSSNGGGSSSKDSGGIQEDLERKVQSLESEISVLMEQLDASDTKSLKRKEKASLAKAKLEQVTHDLEVAERERQALLAREASSAHYISQIERQLANYEYQCNVMNDAVQTCQARESSHAREVNRLSEEVHQSNAELKQCKEQLKISKERVSSVEKEKTFLENAYKDENGRYQSLHTAHEKTLAELNELKIKYEHYGLNQARMVERNDILNESMEKKDFELAKQKRQLDSALSTIKELQKQILQKDTQQPVVQLQPAIQQQPSTTSRKEKISNQVITGPPKAKNEAQKEDDDNTRASKLTKNALAGMKRMKKRKPPKRPATPTKDKDNSSRLAAMKLKLKAELKKQTEAAVPKKKHQDFLGLGYKTKESKALEDTVTS